MGQFIFSTALNHRIYIHLDEGATALIKAFAMNLLDIFIIVVMVILVLRGLFRGFFMEIASLAGVILGILLGIRLHPGMTDILRPHLDGLDLFILQLISFTLIFLAVLISSNLVGWGIKTILKKTSLSWTDKILGACLAVLKGVVIIYLAIVILTILVPSKTPLVARSKLAPWIITSYQSAAGLISPEFYQNWKRKVMGEKK